MMIDNEVFILSRHGNIGSVDVISKLPTYKRRYYLNKLEEELREVKDREDSAMRKAKSGSR